MKNIFTTALLTLCLNSFAQNINIVAQPLREGAVHKWWWLDKEKQDSSYLNSNRHRIMSKRGLNILELPEEQELWTKFEKGAFYYFFWSNIKNSIDAKFLVQRIKKTVIHYKNNKEIMRKETYLVEAFKTWSNYDQVNGTLKSADGHDGIFYNLGKNKKKVILKEFETGIATIEGLAEDSNVWFDKPGSLYFGTKYNSEGEKLYSKVKFTDSQVWNLNVEVTPNGYLIESPELGIYEESM